MALERTNIKFINRFKYMEENVKKTGKLLHDITLKEMDVLWNNAKEIYK
jgi:XTP/dITP diphosphohydrolase